MNMLLLRCPGCDTFSGITWQQVGVAIKHLSMKVPAVFLACFITCSITAQVGSFTDPRDGQTYATIVIGKHTWFREHLRYETTLSYFPNSAKHADSLSRGNYYSNKELGSICPKGWHVATLSEWEEYISVMLARHHIPKDSVTSKIFPPPNNSTAVTIKHLHIFNDTLLYLTPIGWVEGNKIANDATLSLWITGDDTKDNRYHVHIGPEGYVKHTHKHHVEDKPKRVRRFAVRCVCELQVI
jgi:uncharacterized protein (TIGR02145 family)